MAGAKDHFADDPDVIFPIRTITRPADAGGETHNAVDERTFDQMRNQGAFALNWEAHGLMYGVPISINDDLKHSRRVVVNVSRAILDDARTQYGNLSVVSITTSADVLMARLKARGRESDTEIASRLKRAAAMKPTGKDVIEIDNSGELKDGIARLVGVLSERP